jgi:hypothetical protein
LLTGTITRIPLRSVTRQFHNLKRIYAAMEGDEEEDFNLFTFVSLKYRLSPHLSRKYVLPLPLHI